MARLRRRYNHEFLTETVQVNDARVLDGMVITFLYNAPKIYDRNPNVFVLNWTKDLLFGINMNYLAGGQARDMIRRIVPIAPPTNENFVQAENDYTRFQMGTKFSPSPVNGKFVWNRLSVNPKIKQAHRTYKRRNMSAVEIRIVDFERLGIIPDEN